VAHGPRWPFPLSRHRRIIFCSCQSDAFCKERLVHKEICETNFKKGESQCLASVCKVMWRDRKAITQLCCLVVSRVWGNQQFCMYRQPSSPSNLCARHPKRQLHQASQGATNDLPPMQHLLRKGRVTPLAQSKLRQAPAEHAQGATRRKS